jgi:putative acetyltransferase
MIAAVGGVALRPEMPADAAGVRALLLASFGGPAEATLVERLRTDASMVLALVAVVADAVVGYVGFARVTIESDGEERPAVALAPLAVDAAHQGRGIGATLVRAGLDALFKRGEEIVFVVGEPAVYGRFGFAAEHARPFAAPFVGSHFMARRLMAKAPRRGRVRYPAAFDTPA